MNETTLNLESDLQNAASDEERIDILNLHVRGMYRSDAAACLALVRESARLARKIGDRQRLGRSGYAEGLCHWVLGDVRSAERAFNRNLRLARETGDSEYEGRALQSVGFLRHDAGHYPEAINLYNQALEIARATSSRSREAYVLNSIGLSLDFLASYDQALAHYRSAVAIFEALDEHAGLLLVVNNVGRVFLSLEDPNGALQEFEKMRELARRVDDRLSEVSALLNTGIALSRIQRATEANAAYHRGLELAREIGSRFHESYLLTCIAEQYFHRDELEQALDSLQGALQIAREIGSAHQWTVLRKLADVWMKQDECRKAVDTLNEVLAWTIESGDRNAEFHVHELLSDCHERLGNTAEALDHHKRYTRVRELAVGQEQQRAMMAMKMRSEVERSERERSLLQARNGQLEQEMDQKKRELTAMALHLVEKQNFLDSLRKEMNGVVRTVQGESRPAVRGLLRQVEGNIDADEEWAKFERQFELIHNHLLQRLAQEHPDLTRAELKVCALLKINLSNKESAQLLSTSTRTIENHRYNIRKKLGVPTETRLTTYFAGL